LGRKKKTKWGNEEGNNTEGVGSGIKGKRREKIRLEITFGGIQIQNLFKG